MPRLLACKYQNDNERKAQRERGGEREMRKILI